MDPVEMPGPVSLVPLRVQTPVGKVAPVWCCKVEAPEEPSRPSGSRRQRWPPPGPGWGPTPITYQYPPVYLLDAGAASQRRRRRRAAETRGAAG